MDLTDPEDKRLARKAAREAKVAQAERSEVIQGIMRTPLGRAWMLSKLELCHVFQSSFKGEASHSTAFAEGERNIGLILLSEIMEAVPEAYILMMGEQNARRSSPAWDRSDPDDHRNWDGDEWIGSGPEPTDRDA